MCSMQLMCRKPFAIDRFFPLATHAKALQFVSADVPSTCFVVVVVVVVLLLLFLFFIFFVKVHSLNSSNLKSSHDTTG